MCLVHVCDGVALCCLGARVSSHIACSGCGECCERRMDPVCEVVEVDVCWAEVAYRFLFALILQALRRR